ncbi:hypothetical protein AB0A95_34600 [Micromonospora sp. NPDC049230]|uniref:hypothetical protein n=1 Tax=Micromonospora sp. NPDC049230 TaxID=3155502 RepID=UPI0033FCE1EB
MEHIDRTDATLSLRTLAVAVTSGRAPLPLMRVDDSEGHRMRIIPRLLHNVLCDWRIGTQQDTDPPVIGCAGCGFCYPPESVDPTGTTTGDPARPGIEPAP